MKSKIGWLILSCFMMVALVLASCAPAAVEEEEVAPVVEEEEVAEEEEVVKEEKEMVKDALGRMVQKPQYGGVLTMAMTADTGGFDDCITLPWHNYSIQITNDGLLTGDFAKGQAGTNEISNLFTGYMPVELMTGAIAESWEFPDEETVIFHIRKGVRFALNPEREASRMVGGREVTADDVVFSINRYYYFPTSHLVTKPEDVKPASVTATDKYTVVLKAGPAAHIFATFNDTLCSKIRVYASEVMEKYGDASDWENSVGAGAFILVDYVPGSSITYERNPNYYAKHHLYPEDQMPYPDGVVQMVIIDRSTRLAALRTAAVDWIAGAYWEEKDNLLATKPELKVRGTPGTAPYQMAMRTDKPPFDDIRVRKALSMALDRQKIIDTVYGGNAYILAFPILPEPDFKAFYTPLEELPQSAREQFEYNPEKARQLLAEAGYPEGFKTEIVTTKDYVDELLVVKEYFADIGVDLAVNVKEMAVWRSIEARRTHEHMLYRYISSSFPYQFKFAIPGYYQNGSFIDDPRINETIAWIAAHGWDDAECRKRAKDDFAYALEQVWYIAPPAKLTYYVWWPWVKDYNGEYSVGRSKYYNWPKWVWIDQDLKEDMTRRR